MIDSEDMNLLSIPSEDCLQYARNHFMMGFFEETIIFLKAGGYTPKEYLKKFEREQLMETL